MNLDRSLTEESFKLGLKELATKDEDFAEILEKWGNPPRWEEEIRPLPKLMLAQHEAKQQAAVIVTTKTMTKLAWAMLSSNLSKPSGTALNTSRQGIFFKLS